VAIPSAKTSSTTLPAGPPAQAESAASCVRVFAPREVLTRADTHALRQGFISIGLNRTANTAEYTKRIRPSVREEEGRVRLTFKTSQKGDWPDVRHELERWVAEGLGGVRGPAE
jgi:hypothetical protein